MLGGDDDRGILVEPAFLELGYEFADRRVGELDFVDQSRGWRAGGVEIATVLLMLFSTSFWPTLTTWKFMPKTFGTRRDAVHRDSVRRSR